MKKFFAIILILIILIVSAFVYAPEYATRENFSFLTDEQWATACEEYHKVLDATENVRKDMNDNWEFVKVGTNIMIQEGQQQISNFVDSIGTTFSEGTDNLTAGISQATDDVMKSVNESTDGVLTVIGEKTEEILTAIKDNEYVSQVKELINGFLNDEKK